MDKNLRLLFLFSKVVPTAILVICCTLSAYSQSNPNRFWQWMKADPVDMVTDIGTDQIVTIASVGTALSIVSFGDATISQNMQAHYKNSDYLNFSNHWGDWAIVTPISAGVFATSLLTDNTKFQDAAFTSLQSLLLTNITVNTSKFLISRARPAEKDGPHDIEFADFEGTSFPSGHTATAFALVTPWVVYYPGPVTYSLLAIPAGTAIARVAKGRHWITDVAAGAAVGVSIGYYLSKKHLGLQSEHLQVTPSVGRNNFSLSLNFSF